MLNSYAESIEDLEDDLDGDIEECLERIYADLDAEEEVSAHLQSKDAGVY